MATPPPQNAPRPMTLPTRGAVNRMRNRVLELNGTNCRTSMDDNFNQKSPPSPSCESPSYLLNTHSTFYKFPQTTRLTTEHSNLSSQDDGNNVVPLPPRDGKKHIATNAKRHVRKYPLIIPANGVQRTLNKVTEKTPNDDEQKWPTINHDQCSNSNGNGSNNNQNNSKLNANKTNLQRITHEVVATVRPTTTTTTAVMNNESTNCIYQNGDIVQKLKEIKTASKAEHDYMNLDCIEKDSKTEIPNSNSNTVADDTASLQFETIMESDFDKSLVLQSPDVTDGFYNFSIQKEHYNKSKNVVDYDPEQISGLYVNEDELRNLDIEHSVKLLTPPSTSTRKKLTEASKIVENVPKTVTTSTTITLTQATTTVTPTTTTENEIVKNKVYKGKTTDNELAGHTLFKKVRQSIDTAMNKVEIEAITDNSCSSSNNTNTGNSSNIAKDTCEKSAGRQQTEAEYFAATAARLADSNSVSCEDLLEFADQKPKGRDRGVDSDEVRIMQKVLGTQCTAERCLASLEFIDWDVHKAIKVIKLQNILPDSKLSFADAVKALQQYEWDLHTTAMKLKGVKT